MVSDQQVKKLFRFDTQGMPKILAADKAGLDPKTAQKYRSLQRLPSEVSVNQACHATGKGNSTSRPAGGLAGLGSSCRCGP